MTRRPARLHRRIAILVVRDLRRVGPVWIALLVAAALDALVASAGPGRETALLEPGIFLVGLHFVIGLWWTHDPLHDERAFWRSRGLRARDVAMAKLIGALGVVAGGTWILDGIVRGLLSRDPAQIFWITVESTPGFSFWVVVSSGIGAGSRSMVDFVARTAGLLLASIAGSMALAWLGSAHDGGIVVDARVREVWPVIAAVVLVVAHAWALSRRGRVPSTLAIVVVVASGLLVTPPITVSVDDGRRPHCSRPDSFTAPHMIRLNHS